MVALTKSERRRVARKCAGLAFPRGNYHDNYFVSNLVQTVLDYHMQAEVLDKAYDHFENNHWDNLQNDVQLERFLARFPDTKRGNYEGAKVLWGYRYGKRFRQLRHIHSYFRNIGVKDQASLRRWARQSSFEGDFKGKVKGLAFAVYKWLQIRVGVETVKPDVHIKRFLKRTIGRKVADKEAVCILEQVACEIGWKAHKLDWAIWEHEKARQR